MPADDPKHTHPGAAFGIPEGAQGEDVVDAVLGASGIDPELLPYLEASGGRSLTEAGAAQAEADLAVAQAQEADLSALRELVAANMLPAGDLDQLDALLAEVDADDSDDWQSWEPQLPDAPGQSVVGQADQQDGHRARLRAAARAVEVSERMRQVEAEILSRGPEHRIQPSLERVEAVLDILGHPERAYRVVHVTGTNGKTSTARMAERLLAATGMRTGRFTSPHLATIRDRISLDGEPISEEGLIATWDSTNVVDSEVQVITPVGRDHGVWLGETLEEIAANKAGIIKDGGTLITAVQPPAVQAVIAAAAAEHSVVWRRELSDDEDPGAPEAGQLAVVDRALGVGGQMVTLRTAAATYEDVFVPLHGAYQASNALLALAAVEAVFAGRALPPKVVEDGFASVTSPGRLEVLRSSPTVVVDAAHNPHGMEALVGALEEVFDFSHLAAVVGVMADKDAEGILAVLEPVTDAVVVVPIDSPRAMDPEDLAAIAREVYGDDRVHVAADLAAGVDKAAELSEGFDEPLTSSGVLVAGSVLLAAEARALFRRA